MSEIVLSTVVFEAELLLPTQGVTKAWQSQLNYEHKVMKRHEWREGVEGAAAKLTGERLQLIEPWCPWLCTAALPAAPWLGWLHGSAARYHARSAPSRPPSQGPPCQLVTACWHGPFCLDQAWQIPRSAAARKAALGYRHLQGAQCQHARGQMTSRICLPSLLACASLRPGKASLRQAGVGDLFICPQAWRCVKT